MKRKCRRCGKQFTVPASLEHKHNYYFGKILKEQAERLVKLITGWYEEGRIQIDENAIAVDTQWNMAVTEEATLVI